jgi:methylphosphotriester-DNA--protein-cysteine methyltransferase
VRDVRVFRGRSRIYHDEHRTITPVEWFDSPAAAEAAGLRPCGVCKP